MTCWARRSENEVPRKPSAPSRPKVSAIGQDAGGNVWISTLGCGVSHFDGRRFTPPDSARPRHKVMSFLRRRTGELWLTAAQESGGLWSYDGRQLTRHVQPDPANVLATFMETLGEDSRGALWIATWGGLCRYRSSATPPVAVIRNVVTDRRRGPLAAVDLPASQDYLAIEFGTTSPGAVPGRTLYRYRLRGRHDSWRATGGKQVEYPDLPIGDHEFQVRAVDPDLNQSEPVTVRVSVHAPPYGDLALADVTGHAMEAAILVVGNRLEGGGLIVVAARRALTGTATSRPQVDAAQGRSDVG